jgi:coatomer subunit beta'
VEWSTLGPGRLLASTSNDCTARVWDLDRGECVALLEGHTQEVRAVCFHCELPHILFTGEGHN